MVMLAVVAVVVFYKAWLVVLETPEPLEMLVAEDLRAQAQALEAGVALVAQVLMVTRVILVPQAPELQPGAGEAPGPLVLTVTLAIQALQARVQLLVELEALAPQELMVTLVIQELQVQVPRRVVLVTRVLQAPQEL